MQDSKALAGLIVKPWDPTADHFRTRFPVTTSFQAFLGIAALRVAHCACTRGGFVTHKVVAHFIGGKVVKGISHDINAQKPFCHIRTLEQESIPVKLSDLKALFFVRDLAGDSQREEGRMLE